MGIENIHILISPDIEDRYSTQIMATYQRELILAHRRGEHPYGSMRRECPLCQAE